MEIQKNIPNNLKIEFLEIMYTIRKFESELKKLYSSGLIRGSLHLYIGEEAIAAGACLTLNEEDYIFSTHRGHGHCIAKGAEINKMMAELLGKETGYCKGKGGSMHMAAPEKGILGSLGIVGSGMPLAIGSALSSKYLKNGKVTICFFGDGAANHGNFHECLNLAAIWKLPVVFICENNMYAISLSSKKSTSIKNIADRSTSYGIPGFVIDGNIVEEVYLNTKEAVVRARKGEGPTLIEAKTYRMEGHFTADPQIYRTKEEVKEWKKKDPIDLYMKKLMKEDLIKKKEFDNIKEKIDRMIEKAEKFAKESSSLPIDRALDDIYI